MNLKTQFRGETIFGRKEVIPCQDSRPPFFYHFKVKQRKGEWTDVWYSGTEQNMQWSCNAVSEKNNGKRWGCPLYVGPKDKPFCSHTYAVELYIEEAKKNVG